MKSSAEEMQIKLNGRCYCGAITITSSQLPRKIAYCHCSDCRRWTSAPVAAFAAFDIDRISFTPNQGRKINITAGVTRTFCPECGSPISGQYDYLPGQIYIGVSLFDQASELAPMMHTHISSKIEWLHIDDELERHATSGRVSLNNE